ncbi:GNAT family N-acetyltransferase [Actinopolymorpha sp. B11F2]|uniref:GNAT family N-acetyltransferase n=1 Tax=Actinopolymorpha sp. B11F2 TaxID=3160862 RepID=UPI0032E3ECC4
MPEVTDMILRVDDHVVPGGPEVELLEVGPGSRAAVLALVSSEHGNFLQYYESPAVGTVVCGIYERDQLVGAVLLEYEPEARESRADAALAALVIAGRHRGRGIATAAIGAACRMLRAAGYRRVIAEWVWSRQAYERLGFRVWRTRSIPR